MRVLLLSLGILSATIAGANDLAMLFESGQLDTLKSKAKAMTAQKQTSAEGYYWLGKVAHKQQDLETALDAYEEAVDLDGNNPIYLKAFGQTACNLAQNVSMFRAAGLASDCKKSFEKVTQLSPEDIDNRDALIGFYLGAPAIAGGSEDKALVQAKEIAKLNPERGAVALARVYQKQEKYPEALAELDKAIATSENPNPILFSKGALQQSQKDWLGARTSFNAILSKEPGYLDAWYQLGRSALLAEKSEWYEEGRAAFETYLKADVDETRSPSKAWASLRLGQLLDKMGKSGEADTYFSIAAKVKDDERLQKELKTRAPK